MQSIPLPTKKRALQLGAALVESELARVRSRAEEDDRLEANLAERHVLSAIDLGVSAGILRTLESLEDGNFARTVRVP